MDEAKVSHTGQSESDLGPRTEALLAFYREQCEHGRHTENQRHAAATMLLTSAGILLSVIGALKFSIHTLPLAICIVGLGLFGREFIQLFSVKWNESSARRNHYRTLIQSSLGIPDAPKGESAGSIRGYWRFAFTAVALIGGLCIALSLAVMLARASDAGRCDGGNPFLKELAGCSLPKDTD